MIVYTCTMSVVCVVLTWNSDCRGRTAGERATVTCRVTPTTSRLHGIIVSGISGISGCMGDMFVGCNNYNYYLSHSKYQISDFCNNESYRPHFLDYTTG